MPEQDDRDRPTQLEYRDAKEDTPEILSPTMGLVALGAAFGFVVAFALAIVLILSQSDLTYHPGAPGRPTPRWVYLPPVALAVAGLAAGVLLLRRRSRRDVGAGLLIGLGLAVLIYGACFAAMN